MASEKLIQELNRLQRRLYESYREFNTTQDNVDSKDLINFFYEQASQRKEYYESIREAIQSLGEIPKNVTRPFSDAADEIFTDIKSVFFTEDDKMILQESKQVEKRLLQAYDEVLGNAELPAKLRAVLDVQREEVLTDLESISNELDRVSHK